MTNLFGYPMIEHDFKAVMYGPHARVKIYATQRGKRRDLKYKWYGLPWWPTYISGELMRMEKNLFRILPHGWDLKIIHYDRRRDVYTAMRGRYL